MKNYCNAGEEIKGDAIWKYCWQNKDSNEIIGHITEYVEKELSIRAMQIRP